MDRAAKQELAKAILDASREHEASWYDDDGEGRYLMTFEHAAIKAGVDYDLVPLVATMMVRYRGDYTGWADQMLKQPA